MNKHLSQSGDSPRQRRELLDGPCIRQDGVMVNLFECGEDFNGIELQVSNLAVMGITSTWFPRESVEHWGNGDFTRGVAAARDAAYTQPLQLIECGFLGLPSQSEQ